MQSLRYQAAAAVLLSLTAALPGVAMEKATVQARLPADRTVSFDVYLPVQHRDQLESLITELHTAGSPNYQKWLTPQQFHQRFGVTAAATAAVTRELSNAGLTVTSVHPQRLHVTGTSATVERLFGTELHTGVLRSGAKHVMATRSLSLPQSLQQVNGLVVGLSANLHMRKFSTVAKPTNRYSTSGPYWFTDLKEAYKFPSYQTYTGKGTNIAILMAGAFQQSDMDLHFSHEKLTRAPFNQIDVDGGAPFDPDGSTESHLDLQQSGGMAPGATVTLYNIPDLYDNHILDGLTQIIEDNKADVVSMSFGGPELFYTADYNDGVDYTADLQMMDDVFAQGNAQGISFVASSGDSGGLVPRLHHTLRRIPCWRGVSRVQPTRHQCRRH